MAKPTEKVIHQQVCDYLKLQYPNVIFTSDASGMRVSIGLRVELKRKRCNKYVILDIIILHPAKGYHGLVIEVKRDLSEVFKKGGVMKQTEHLIEQKKSIDRLNELGYLAAFGCGFEHCKRIIDNYLN